MEKQQIENELKKYDITEASLQRLRDQYLPLAVTGVDDKEGYMTVYEAHQEIKKLRQSIEEKRVDLGKDAMEFKRAVDAEAKRLTAEVKIIEDHLAGQRKIVEDEKARLKAEAERKEREEREAKEREEREAREKAEREAQEAKERAEKAEREAREATERAERAEREAKEAKEKAERDEQERKDREAREAQEKADAEERRKREHEEAIEKAKQEERDRIAREQREKEEADAKAKAEEEERQRQEEEERKRLEALQPDLPKISKLIADITHLKIPELGSEDAFKAVEQARIYLNNATGALNRFVTENTKEAVNG